jgi:hypothetical protein
MFYRVLRRNNVPLVFNATLIYDSEQKYYDFQKADGHGLTETYPLKVSVNSRSLFKLTKSGRYLAYNGAQGALLVEERPPKSALVELYGSFHVAEAIIKQLYEKTYNTIE